MSGHCDLLLRSGLVVDGTGAPGRRADVAVRGDRIAEVGDLSGWEAETVLDAAGLVVAPGFIDMHSHSDLALLIDGRAESKIRQGVTTEVIGQCGFSPAPCPSEQKEAVREVIRSLFGRWGEAVEWNWLSFADYLEVLRGRGTSLNVVPLVGHSIIRAGIVGQDDRAPTAEELEAMEAAVEAAVGEGAFGISTGLAYVPGMFAETGELIALAAAAARGGGLYFSHIRGEGETLLGAVAEAVEIGRRGRASVQISHMKAEGRANWGKVDGALTAVDQAQSSGVDVTFDVYPYTAWNTSLAQLVPSWAREGGPAAMVERLKEPGVRASVRGDLAAAAEADPGRWARRLLASVGTEANRPLQGKSIADIAAARGAAPEEVVIDLLIEERGRASMVGFGMSEADVRRVVTHRLAVIGSDAAAVAPTGLLGEGHPHPRSYGTFPRVLGEYVREHKLLSLEDGVAKMTGRPAKKLGLTDRGRVAAGCAADLVVFDPAEIADAATYEEPHQFPVGIRWVVVNGVVEVDGDRQHDRRAGRVLARQGG